MVQICQSTTEMLLPKSRNCLADGEVAALIQINATGSESSGGRHCAATGAPETVGAAPNQVLGRPASA